MIIMAEALAQIDELTREADAELAEIRDAAALEQFRIKYLGSNGRVKALMKLMGGVPKEAKPAFGQRANGAKEAITAAFEAKKQSLAASDAGEGKDYVDVTEPGKQPEMGNRHILMKVVDELVELFARMGFAVAEGPEVEDEFHNFIALNIPESHPARDPLDNFYLQSDEGTKRRSDEEGKGAADAPPSSLRGSVAPSLRLLRTQTSTVQIRVMEQQKPPIRVVIPGRVYRPDTVDATHLFMFHQLEALVIDKDVTMVDLKSTVLQFVRGYFGAKAQVRFRPSFFPFTEPSAEVDVWFEDKQKWIELGGCGMVHPNVLKAVHIDPEEYTGWAFGFGIERIAMRKYGITDIRDLVANDIRFLKQF
jgi:phenylalanyl-tRNA synthetase alpha chain